jgi:hypothetical protein
VEKLQKKPFFLISKLRPPTMRLLSSVARRGFHASAAQSKTIQAVFLDYACLNRHDDYMEDIEAKKDKLVREKLTSKLILTDAEMKEGKLSSESGDMPWQFSMHAKAKEALAFLDAEGIAVGIVLPEIPVQVDVDRFMDEYGGRFQHVIQTEDTKLLAESSEPLERACQALGMETHKVMFAGHTEKLIKAAKEVTKMRSSYFTYTQSAHLGQKLQLFCQGW